MLLWDPCPIVTHCPSWLSACFYFWIMISSKYGAAVYLNSDSVENVKLGGVYVSDWWCLWERELFCTYVSFLFFLFPKVGQWDWKTWPYLAVFSEMSGIVSLLLITNRRKRCRKEKRRNYILRRFTSSSTKKNVLWAHLTIKDAITNIMGLKLSLGWIGAYKQIFFYQ